ncbi:MAG: hypothetical protein Q8L48_26205 [Archangium sp.]|nr:hypothetical protein [Archangium sp.]
MKPFSSGELHIDVTALSATRFRFDWRGRSASRAPGVDLQPWLTNVIAEACATRAAIEMHFEALEYFNSSTVAVLVDFVRVACDKTVPLTLSYSADVRWQRLTFQALRVFSVAHHHVKVAPIAAA